MATHTNPQRHINERRVDRTPHRRRLALGAGAVIAAVAASVIAFLGWPSDHATAPLRASTSPAADGLLPGVREVPPPWQPEYANLSARLAALHLPRPGHETYHIHAHLSVFINGLQVSVPTEIGMDDVHGIASALHTHDATGLVHVEADSASPAFTLGSFFNVWGVALSNDRIGSFTTDGERTVRLYVNGRRVNDVAGYVLAPHDNVVLAYGTDSSFPHEVDFTFGPGE